MPKHKEQSEAEREYRYGKSAVSKLRSVKGKPEYIIESYSMDNGKEKIMHQFLVSCWSAARTIIDIEISKGHHLKVFNHNHYKENQP